jgi:uncharacterized protein YbjT (DUF2867 family)
MPAPAEHPSEERTMIPLNRPLIVVLGATGAEGGGLARALLEHHRYAVRAITRHPGSPRAQALQEAGAELMAADLDDAAALSVAFTGAHGVYAVTSQREHGSPERELRQATAIAEAARRAGVRHVIWSTAEDTRRCVPLHDPRLPTLDGQWKVPVFDAKGAADAVFDELELPLTRLYTSFPWESLLHDGLHPQRDADGTLVLTLPLGGVALPGIAAEDIGRCAAAVFERGTWTIGRTIGLAGEHLTATEMAATLATALGEPVRAEEPSRGEYASRGVPPRAATWANLFGFVQLCNARVRAARPVEDTRALHPGALDFAGWLARHAHRLPIAPRRAAIAQT